VEELEHKSRRQDVLVDDELIYAFYDQQLPPTCAAAHAGALVPRGEVRQAAQAAVAHPRRADAPRGRRHHHQRLPQGVRLGGVDCAASYLHEPGDARDGLTVTVPLFVLNQVSEERCEWLVPGMLKDKIQALLKSLPQRPARALCRCPTAPRVWPSWVRPSAFGAGSLTDALLKQVRDATSLDVKRADFKLDMLSPHHLFMNFRVVDEHGRQLGRAATWRAQGRAGRAGARRLPGAGRAEAAALAAGGRAAAEKLVPNRPPAPVDADQQLQKR
jgi:ATP-dependent helicase HrpA